MDRDALIAKIVSEGRDERGVIKRDSVFLLREMDVKPPDISRLFNVSRNAIYKILKDRPDLLPQKNRNEQIRLAPWKDQAEAHKKAAQRSYVSHHIEYMLTNGKGMEEYKLARLRHFYRELGDPQEYVLTYSRNEKPNQWSGSGGWRYERMEDSDGNLIVRTEDDLTEEQKKVFVRPENWKQI